MINSYRFGEIVINKRTFLKDVIIYPDDVFCPWWRKEGHNVYEDDIKDIIKFKPDLLIFGTGSPGKMKVPNSIIKKLTDLNIKVLKLPTKDAVEKYNETFRNTYVIGAFHLTC